jgi:hypothetical protein
MKTMKYEDRLDRKTAVVEALKELFPTATEEVESADDFCTGKFLFRFGWNGKLRGVFIEI